MTDTDRIPVPPEPDELLRYRGTPEISGQTVVIAPEDTAAALGLDLHSGAILWEKDSALTSRRKL